MAGAVAEWPAVVFEPFLKTAMMKLFFLVTFCSKVETCEFVTGGGLTSSCDFRKRSVVALVIVGDEEAEVDPLVWPGDCKARASLFFGMAGTPGPESLSNCTSVSGQLIPLSSVAALAASPSEIGRAD